MNKKPHIGKKIMSGGLAFSLATLSLASLAPPSLALAAELPPGTPYTITDENGNRFTYQIKRTFTGTGHGTNAECWFNSANTLGDLSLKDDSADDDNTCYNDVTQYVVEWTVETTDKGMILPKVNIQDNIHGKVDNIGASNINPNLGKGTLTNGATFNPNISGSGNFFFTYKAAFPVDSKTNPNVAIPAPYASIDSFPDSKIQADKGFNNIVAPFIDIKPHLTDLNINDNYRYQGNQYYSFDIKPLISNVPPANKKGSIADSATIANFIADDGLEVTLEGAQPIGALYTTDDGLTFKNIPLLN